MLRLSFFFWVLNVTSGPRYFSFVKTIVLSLVWSSLCGLVLFLLFSKRVASLLYLMLRFTPIFRFVLRFALAVTFWGGEWNPLSLFRECVSRWSHLLSGFHLNKCKIRSGEGGCFWRHTYLLSRLLWTEEKKDMFNGKCYMLGAMIMFSWYICLACLPQWVVVFTQWTFVEQPVTRYMRMFGQYPRATCVPLLHPWSSFHLWTW